MQFLQPGGRVVSEEGELRDDRVRVVLGLIRDGRGRGGLSESEEVGVKVFEESRSRGFEELDLWRESRSELKEGRLNEKRRRTMMFPG